MANKFCINYVVDSTFFDKKKMRFNCKPPFSWIQKLVEETPRLPPLWKENTHDPHFSTQTWHKNPNKLIAQLKNRTVKSIINNKLSVINQNMSANFSA